MERISFVVTARSFIKNLAKMIRKVCVIEAVTINRSLKSSKIIESSEVML